MATYESRYQQLGFYVDRGFRRFSGGLFHTDDPAEMAVLDALSDAVRIDKNVPEEPATKEGVSPSKPVPKTSRKAGTSSAK